MQQINPNPSPKQRFIGIKACVDRHSELVQRPDLQTGLEQALLQYQWQLCESQQTDGNSSAANFYRLAGVHEFIRTFKLLAVTTVAPKPEPVGEISHTFK